MVFLVVFFGTFSKQALISQENPMGRFHPPPDPLHAGI